MDYFGRKCLAARRLIERGVASSDLVPATTTASRRNWDSHEDVRRDHARSRAVSPAAAAALIQDLKQRGLLEDTVILGPRSSAHCLPRRAGKGAITIPIVLPIGSAGEESKAE